VTVTAVDTAKSILHMNIKGGQTYRPGFGDYPTTLAGIALTNSTTLTWTGCYEASVTGAQHPTIYWQLVEYK
jgi:hypothetical protein